MKHHLMLAIGLLMALIFAYQGALAITEPGLGFQEAYVVGGLLIAAYLIWSALKEWKHARENKK